MYNYLNSGHYILSSLSFTTSRFGDWILSPSSGVSTQLVQTENVSPKDGERTQTPKRYALNKRQDNEYCPEIW
jgi:hypothetical protein